MTATQGRFQGKTLVVTGAAGNIGFETARRIQAVPMRRLGGIEEIPGTVAFLMSDDASYITGVNIPIAGGIL